MRCQRCGFEIEPGQTFCSMCGTEQSKALRETKQKKKIGSILGIIKITSNNHLKMWGVFGLTIVLMIYILIALKGNHLQIPYFCCNIVLILYVLFQVLVPYKNPNSSKSKKYKLAIRTTFACALLLALLVFIGEFDLIGLVKKI